jgi:hypothetical protein
MKASVAAAAASKPGADHVLLGSSSWNGSSDSLSGLVSRSGAVCKRKTFNSRSAMLSDADSVFFDVISGAAPTASEEFDLDGVFGRRDGVDDPSSRDSGAPSSSSSSSANLLAAAPALAEKRKAGGARGRMILHNQDGIASIHGSSMDAPAGAGDDMDQDDDDSASSRSDDDSMF